MENAYNKNEIEETLSPDIEDLHTQALLKNEDTYIDPITGFTVFTRIAHLKKKRCCGNYCRHCPYNHCNVARRGKCHTLREKGEVKNKEDKKCEDRAEENIHKVSQHSEVYTKGGDKGTSALFTGERRRKTDVVFEALGATDELSSHAGLARSFLLQNTTEAEHFKHLSSLLEDIQQQLLNIGTVIATPAAGKDAASCPLIKLIDSYNFPEKTAELEKEIDQMDSRLKPIRAFILPGGGTPSSAQLHVCRTTCRRSERRMIEVKEVHGAEYTNHLHEATVYVNRLSDFFFVAARSVAEEDIGRKYD